MNGDAGPGDLPVFCVAVAAGIAGGVAVLALCTAGFAKAALWVNELMGGGGLCTGW